MGEDVLARMNDGEMRDRILLEFNASTLDDVGPLGGDQGMAVLKDLNMLQTRYDELARSLAPEVIVLQQKGRRSLLNSTLSRGFDILIHVKPLPEPSISAW